jgi:hypothetical protein
MRERGNRCLGKHTTEDAWWLHEGRSSCAWGNGSRVVTAARPGAASEKRRCGSET